MSKSNPYPTSYRDYEKHVAKNQKAVDENNDHSHGGPGSLPNQEYDSTDDNYFDGAKTWTGDQSVFE
jgi:hypothetical protein